MGKIRNIFTLIFIQHILHFRWLVSRYNPYLILNKRMVLQVIVTLSISLSLVFYFTFLSVFHFLQTTGITLSLSLIKKMYVIFYILLFISLIRGSFNEVYLRAFFSHDVQLLRLRNTKTFNIQFAKLVDAYFLNIIIFVLPLQVGIFYSMIKVSGLKMPFYSFCTIFGIIIFALICRMTLLLVTYIFGKGNSNSSLVTNTLIFVFKVLIAGLTAFVAVRYFFDKHLLNVWINVLNHSDYFSNVFDYWYRWLPLLTIILFIFNIFILRKKENDFNIYKMMDSKIRNKEKGLILINIFMSEKIHSKIFNVFVKDLLLLIRGENLSLGFIKGGLITSACSLGVITAFSMNFSHDHHQGIFIIIILFHQMILSGLLSAQVGKLSSIELEKNWIILYQSRLKNPYFIYVAKCYLHFLTIFPIILFSTCILLFFIKISFFLILCVLLSAFCVCIVVTLSFILGSVCFPNFRWESKDKVNTSVLGHLTENIFIRSYEVINIAFIGTKSAFLYAKKILLQDFLFSYIQLILVTTSIWSVIILIILKAPLWKGWKVK
ncbi:hypothetical protein [Bacillus sp. FSL R12-0069]|uniref:hypothetical protein n=1 Tax=Bacillus sp. FSL R12-0069 TaxID=2975342 RepID=UPI0030F4E14B